MRIPRPLAGLAAFTLAFLPVREGCADSKLPEWVELSAETELVWAIGTGRGRSQQAQLIFKPETEIELREDLRLTVIGRLRADAYDELEPGHPAQRGISHPSKRAIASPRVDVELREFYLETSVGQTYLTLGKQQIVWGKSDGLKVLDLVNPQSFREFILDEFEDSRIPLWALNAEIPVKDLVVQLLWIPDQTYHDLPEADALYEFTAPIFLPEVPTGIPVEVKALDKPSRVIRDSDVGVRISAFWKGWDLTLNYLYYYDDFPIPFRRLSLTPMGPLVTVTPEYRRSHLVGVTFSNSFGDLTLRGELGYSTDRYFATSDPTDSDGVIETGELLYVLGFDWYGFSETLLSAQLFQIWLTDDESGSVRDQGATTVSFLAQREFMNDRLVASCLWLQSTNNGDGLLRPKLKYELTDSLLLELGADFFYGSKHGLFGEFSPNDRVFVSLEWSL